MNDAATLPRDYFQLFGLEAGFTVDESALTARYRDLQRQTHPDNHANASDEMRRQSVELAAHVNTAYQTLRSPLKRARYLFEHLGGTIDERDTAMDTPFLLQQMALREAIEASSDASDPLAALMTVGQQITTLEQQLLTTLRTAFTPPADLVTLRQVLRKLQFVVRLQEEIAAREEQIADSL
jgi:molecular chaperone HscB